MIQPVLVESIKGRVADQMVDVPMPPVMEGVVAVVQEEEKLVPQERVQKRTVEQVPAPVPQVMEETVAAALVPHERVLQASKLCQCLKIWKRPSRW